MPIGYQAMKDGQIDVFLGNWMPAQQPFRDDLDAAKAAEVIVQNLEGAKFTLAVPTAQASELGVADFKDLAAHADAFESKIYGIETGAPANQNLQKMIDADDFGLGDWTLVESGEQAMLAQVTRAEKSRRRHRLPRLGAAPDEHRPRAHLPLRRRRLLRPRLRRRRRSSPSPAPAGPAECPNAAQFFKNLVFTVDIENEMMGKILDDGESGPDAAEAWIKENPDALGPWLDGVTTLAGEPGLPAVKAALGL